MVPYWQGNITESIEKICVVLDRAILLNVGTLGKILLYVRTNKGNMVKLKGDNCKVTILNIRLECVPIVTTSSITGYMLKLQVILNQYYIIILLFIEDNIKKKNQ